MLWNCKYRYVTGRGKHVFVPSSEGVRIGRELKARIEKRFAPDNFYYHLQEGGHVAALHMHRSHRHFARLDIENFFYSIGRNRVVRVLQEIKLSGAERFGRWSTVRNPYHGPSHVLPYGFVQSPILATLVLSQSPLGACLRQMAPMMAVSVYVDDIAISSDCARSLRKAYRGLRNACVQSNFAINRQKSTHPSSQIELFNCNLEHQSTAVTLARCAEFYSTRRTPVSEAAFQAYVARVGEGNSGQ